MATEREGQRARAPSRGAAAPGEAKRRGRRKGKDVAVGGADAIEPPSVAGGKSTAPKSKLGTKSGELELQDNLWRISNEIEDLKSQLAKKEKEKELWYFQENKKLWVELHRMAKDIEILRKQNEELKAKNEGLHNDASFQATLAAGASGGADVSTQLEPVSTAYARPCPDEVVAAHGLQLSGSIRIVATSSWVRQYWNTLTDKQKKAAIKLHDASDSSIPVYVCDIKIQGIVYFSVEFSTTYLRAKPREKLPLKAFAANKLTEPVDIHFLVNEKKIAFLSRGWSHFATENGIKVGDICAFQFSDKAWSVTVQVIKAAETEDVVETVEQATAGDTGMAADHASGEPPVAARTRGSAASAPVVKRPRPKKPQVSRRDSEAMQCATALGDRAKETRDTLKKEEGELW
ncbi:hypothetical protein ACP70R_031167 [Stipagrostis hirtigluma subsp. patula]